MDRRALLTDREREVLRGDADDVKNLAQYQSKIRSRLRQRIERLEEDLELLDEVEPDLRAEIESKICVSYDERVEKLENDVEYLKTQFDN